MGVSWGMGKNVWGLWVMLFQCDYKVKSRK